MPFAIMKLAIASTKFLLVLRRPLLFLLLLYTISGMFYMTKYGFGRALVVGSAGSIGIYLMLKNADWIVVQITIAIALAFGTFWSLGL